MFVDSVWSKSIINCTCEYCQTVFYERGVDSMEVLWLARQLHGGLPLHTYQMTPVCVSASDTKENLREEMFSCWKYKQHTQMLWCASQGGGQSTRFQSLLSAALRRCEATQPLGFRDWCSSRKLQNSDSERALKKLYSKNVDGSFLKICLVL